MAKIADFGLSRGEEVYVKKTMVSAGGRGLFLSVPIWINRGFIISQQRALVIGKTIDYVADVRESSLTLNDITLGHVSET